VPPGQPVVVGVDDTVARHRGPRVIGVGCYRTACRSSRRRANFTWGHRWVVMAVNVRLPLCPRPWALPVLTALSTPKPKPSSQSRVASGNCVTSGPPRARETRSPLSTAGGGRRVGERRGGLAIATSPPTREPGESAKVEATKRYNFRDSHSAARHTAPHRATSPRAGAKRTPPAGHFGTTFKV
jgi:hypothetical protein